MLQQWWWHGLVVLLVCQALPVCTAQRSLENEFVTLPPAFGKQAPKRLVFNQQDLASCLADLTATTCVLRAPIKLNAEAWKQRFASTYGAAVNPKTRPNITITSGACFNCNGDHNSGDADNGGVVSMPRLEKLDWSGLTGVIALHPGTRLRISNLDMGNFSLKSDYVYSPATPYQSIGSGVSIWPTINGAPNSTFVGLNITGSYYNPSETDDCPRYVEKTLLFLYQSFGQGNISIVSPTAVMIIGPIPITVEVNNGSTGEYAGNATAVYKYVTAVCVERLDKTTAGRMSTGQLAAVIAAPVAGVLLLGGLLLWWLRRRKRRRLAGPVVDQLELFKADGGIALVGVNGKGGPPSNGGDLQGMRDARPMPGVAPPPWSPPVAPAAAAGFAPLAAGGRSAASSARASPHDSAERDVPQSGAAMPIPMQQRIAGAQLPGWESSGTMPSSTLGSGQVAAWSSVPSASTIAGGFATGTAATGLTGLSVSTSRRAGDSRADPTSALLKERSDAAVVKDVRLGPLLGSGSFGRVYKGRWKATPVAVKIIEHYSSAEGVGSSRGNRISAGREMLFATSISHPNLVTTFHISTLSAAQRKAAGQLTMGGSGGMADEPDPRRLSNVSTSSSNSSSGEAKQPDMLETWIVMEYCPKGSLEKVIKSGKLMRADGQPDSVSIYKILMDTASGLDYLHSIGVVHGDLKTANVLLKGGKDQKGISCKITDFGLSRVLDMNASHISTGTHGTVVYMPKELLLTGRMTQATDIYSFGLMMWELFAGQRIMESDEGLSIGQMFHMIAYQNWRPELPPNCPPGYVELMTACWHEDPDRRPSAQQLLRRLQSLQGQARQELVAARKARSAADRDAAGQYTESAGCSESEAAAAAQHLRELRMRATGSTADSGEAVAAAAAAAPAARLSPAQSGQNAQQYSNSTYQGGGGAAGATVSHAGSGPDVGTPDSSYAATHPGTVAGPSLGYKSPFADFGQHSGGAPARASTDQQQGSGTRQGSFHGCLPGSSSLSEDQLQAMQQNMAACHQQQMLIEQQQQAGGTAPAVQPAGMYIPEQYMQTLGWVQQHTSAAAAAPASGRYDGAPASASIAVHQDTQQSEWQTIMHTGAVGFVNPFGQEFVGCLPQFDQLTDPDGHGLQPYIAALEAAAANKAAMGRSRGGRP